MLALTTCVQLLELNVLSKSVTSSPAHQQQQLPAASKIFEWVVQRCFTASQEIADLCFIALAKIYTVYDKEPAGCFPDDCFFNPVLAVTLLNIGSTRLNIHETSIGLLRILNRRYLGSKGEPVHGCDQSNVNFSSTQRLNEPKEVTFLGGSKIRSLIFSRD